MPLDPKPPGGTAHLRAFIWARKESSQSAVCADDDLQARRSKEPPKTRQQLQPAHRIRPRRRRIESTAAAVRARRVFSEHHDLAVSCAPPARVFCSILISRARTKLNQLTATNARKNATGPTQISRSRNALRTSWELSNSAIVAIATTNRISGLAVHRARRRSSSRNSAIVSSEQGMMNGSLRRARAGGLIAGHSAPTLRRAA